MNEIQTGDRPKAAASDPQEVDALAELERVLPPEVPTLSDLWEVRSYDLTGARGRFIHGYWRWRLFAAIHCFFLGGDEEDRYIVFYIARQGSTWP